MLLGRSACRISLQVGVFGSSARASRALAEAAYSWTSPICRLAGLYERPAPARVPERVQLPLASRLGVDKLVHGQRTSIMSYSLALIRTRPYPHTSRRCLPMLPKRRKSQIGNNDLEKQPPFGNNVILHPEHGLIHARPDYQGKHERSSRRYTSKNEQLF